MRLHILIAITAVVMALTATPSAQAQLIVYVDENATGSGSGVDWANAYTELADAINDPSLYDQIWIAKGTYTPIGTVSVDTSVAFVPPVRSIKIYGGFKSGDMNVTDRDPTLNTVILTGDIDPGVTNVRSNNVIRLTASGRSLVLQDVIVEKGNAVASSGGLTASGGGVQLSMEAAFTAVGVEFRENSADRGGAVSSDPGGVEDGGVALSGPFTPAQSGLLHRCWFHSNTAIDGGTVYAFRDAVPNAVNSVLNANSASGNGGAFYGRSSDLNPPFNGGTFQVAASTIVDNIAIGEGGAAYLELAATVARNDGRLETVDTIIWGNTSSNPDVLFEQVAPEMSDDVDLVDTTIQGFTGATPTGWLFTGVEGADPLFIGGTGASRYELQSGSPLLDRWESFSFTADADDADADGITAEPLPPARGSDRYVDVVAMTPDNGDRGAYERDPNPVSAACLGDLDGNGAVDFQDLVILLTNWEAAYQSLIWIPKVDSGDLDGNGQVGFGDLLVMLTNWGPCGAAPIPPPTSVADCIEKLGTSDPVALQACIEAMMRLEAGE